MAESKRMQRRAFLHSSLALPATYLLAACAGSTASAPTAAPAAAPASTDAPAAPTSVPAPTVAPSPVPATVAPAATAQPEATAPGVAVLQPTPACTDDDDEPTLAQTEGPYYTPNTPERASLLEPGVTGTTIVITGQVLSMGCQPIARALLDFWHADDAGQYDNVGFRLRGHQFTDDQGQFRLETIRPGLYTGRTRHIHVKVQAPNGPVLTTQLYFPNEPANDRDSIFNPALLLGERDTEDGKAATFDFVVQAGA